MSLYDDASLIMIPSGVKTGKVYSQKPMDSDGQFTFTRASEASRVNSAGLIEKVRTNLFTESNNFSDSDWDIKAGTFTQGVEDPNGGNDAWSWTSQNTDPFLYQNGKSVSGVGTLSIWVKGVGSTIGKNFELRVASVPYKNVVLTGEWQRVEHFNNTAGGTWVGFEYGNPAVLGDVVHIYQAQYEYGTVATDYIATTSVAVSEGSVANMPRLDYSGGATCPSLLLEPSRTNLVTQSEYFGASTWTERSLSVTDNYATSPDGSVNASRILASGSDAALYQSISVTNGTTYTMSVWLKVASGTLDTTISFSSTGFPDGEGDGGKYKDITVTDTWQRFSLTSTADQTVSTITAPIGGFSGFNSGDDVLMWGAQCEVGNYATSLISTYGTAATRARDYTYFAQSPTANFGTGDFSLFLDVEDVKERSDSVSSVGLIGNRQSGVWWRFYHTSSTNKAYFEVASTAGGYAIIQYSTYTNLASGRHKIGVSRSGTELNIYLDGVSVVSTTATSYLQNFDGTNTKIELNAWNTSSAISNSKWHQCLIFKGKALSNDELATITTL